MIQVYISKYLSLILSFFILSISLWVISLPVLMLLNYLLIYLTKYEKLISYSLAHQINMVIFLLPIIFTIVTTLKIVFTDILVLIKDELLKEEDEIIILNLNETYKDLTSNDIVKMVNEVRSQLNCKMDINILRVKSNIFNAYAMSNLKGQAAIVVYDGLYNSLSFEALKSVIGHEMGHIINKDTIFKLFNFSFQYNIVRFKNYSFIIMNFIQKMSNSIPFLGLFFLIYNLAYRLLVTITDLVLYINNMIQYFGYKQFEYIADNIGAKVTSNKIMIETLTIMKDLEDENKSDVNILMTLLSEHPKTENRIKKLKEG
ncbi:M48 family metalloprotease [Aliarcobacter cryaerophilus]|jgi:Zn-dependent protease with chaperone function|uniref:M48 family metallopeptidase n=1 Tax=Aliarcobacter TaxID=2321111 RepID=UPI0021B61B30|nr:M48 family metallopeptidase [Aliarcobacter cryaerophilus]MCT7471179.1 M48 family metalloprotease [Aliarcobacter cryaerophilus]MCT7539570.1 M48 family metalloprotease [Aliarcobacter cryaerophilus]